MVVPDTDMSASDKIKKKKEENEGTAPHNSRSLKQKHKEQMKVPDCYRRTASRTKVPYRPRSFPIGWPHLTIEDPQNKSTKNR